MIAACTNLASMMEGADAQIPPRFRVLRRGESDELNRKIVCFERERATADDCLVAISQYFTVMPRLLEMQYAVVNEFLNQETLFNKLMAAQEMLRRVSSAQMVFNMLHDIYMYTDWGVDGIIERFGSVILPESFDIHHAEALTEFIVRNMKLMTAHGKIYALIDACVEHIPVRVEDRCDLIVTKEKNQWDLVAHSIMDLVTNHQNYPMDISEIAEETLAQTIRLALRERSTALLKENELQLRQIKNEYLIYILSQPTYVVDPHFKAAMRALSMPALRIFNKLATAARKCVACNQEALAYQYATDIVHSVQGRTMAEETRQEYVAYVSLSLQICMKFITAC